MNRDLLFGRQRHSPIPGRAAVTLVALIALAWNIPVLCQIHETAIHDAAMHGDLAKVKQLLKGNPDLVFSQDISLGQTPLHVAAGNGHRAVAELLLANKADVNARDHNLWTP
jgi:ankyrin repeat protein